METIEQLTSFYKLASDDPRIGASHISVYMALFQFWNQSGFQNPVYFTRQEVMGLAKISGPATYHKCMKDLVDLKCIYYVPSGNPFLKSLVYFK